LLTWNRSLLPLFMLAVPGTLSWPANCLAGGEADTAPWLEEVVVVATRTPRTVDTIPGQVGVIDAAEIQRTLAMDIDRALAVEPGANVQTDGTRFGASSVNLRGIGGNRVKIEIDGVPVRDGFSIGAFANAGRVVVEMDRVKRIELLYGPASVLYGSDALGGVMSITTWDPLALLEAGDAPRRIQVRGAATGMNESLAGSALYAAAGKNHGILAAYTYRSGHELQNQAPADFPDDPQDWDSHDAFARFSYRTDSGNRLRISAGATERRVKTDIRSVLGYGTRYRWTTALAGNDEDSSRLLALDWAFDFGDWRDGMVRFYSSSYDTAQQTEEVRGNAPRPTAIQREFQYNEDMLGMEAYAFRSFNFARSSHRVGLGAEWTLSEVEELRDGLQTSLVDGQASNVILGEAMPVRDFPISRGRELGLWLQDEIDLTGGRWLLIPAVRLDRYRLDPKPDPIWTEDNPETPLVSISTSRLTPRLGVTFAVNESWSLFGHYAAGFRSPPFEDANIGFDIPLFGFRAIPNPDLKSETSDSLEAGFRWRSGSSNLSLSAFYSDYDDFIESRALVGIDPETGDLLFQSRNIDQANIRGVDLKFEQDLVAWSAALDGWLLRLSTFWAEGKNRQNEQPLNSIAPAQAVLQLGWTQPKGAWDVLLTSSWTAQKRPADIDQSIEARFATPAWTTVDLTIGWRPGPKLQLRAGVLNLLDETYWRWLDVANLESDNPMIPALSRPGRYYSLQFQAVF